MGFKAKIPLNSSSFSELMQVDRIFINSRFSSTVTSLFVNTSAREQGTVFISLLTHVMIRSTALNSA